MMVGQTVTEGFDTLDLKEAKALLEESAFFGCAQTRLLRLLDSPMNHDKKAY
jgi:hypothetical protein